MTRYTKEDSFSIKIARERSVLRRFSYLPISERDKGKIRGEDAIVNEAIDKLSALEDIEEYLGIDLITLFKAFKNGIWSKGGGLYEHCCVDNEPQFVSPKEIELGTEWYSEKEHENDTKFSVDEEDALCLYTHEYEDTLCTVRIKDYGRTWALTKEELAEK